MYIIKLIRKNYIKFKYFLILIFIIFCGLLYSCNHGNSIADLRKKDTFYSENGTSDNEENKDEKILHIDNKNPNSLNQIADNEEKSTNDSDNENNTLETIFVYICGNINNPGVYELEKGSRIIDLVEAAGGLCDGAKADLINLAKALEDEEKVYIPNEDDISSGEYELKNEENNTGKSINSDDLSSSNNKINLNNSTKEQLMSLKGIGEKKAQAIINYRNEKGHFNSKEEIMNIQGIKGSAYEKIKDFIYVK